MNPFASHGMLDSAKTRMEDKYGKLGDMYNKMGDAAAKGDAAKPHFCFESELRPCSAFQYFLGTKHHI